MRKKLQRISSIWVVGQLINFVVYWLDEMLGLKTGKQHLQYKITISKICKKSWKSKDSSK
jgi:hypothetical protein